MLLTLLHGLGLLIKYLNQLRRTPVPLQEERTGRTEILNTAPPLVLELILSQEQAFDQIQGKQQASTMISTSTKATDLALTLNSENSVESKIINFPREDKHRSHDTMARNIEIIASPGTHDHGSSKVVLKNIVDYKWEIQNYPGHLIAVHMTGHYIAYAINVVKNKTAGMEGMVRVVKPDSSLRALIKGMTGEVLDLQFAHIEKDYILASIDINSLYVHRVEIIDDNIFCDLLIKVEDPLSKYAPKYDKISWCPFVDDGSSDYEDSHLIVWARGSTFQVFNVKIIVAEHGSGSIRPEEMLTGYLKLQLEGVTITWTALSPDGTTLGVGGDDGVIRFYQVYIHEEEPRCLHQWTPHDGRAVSSFFFLDNLTSTSLDAYWKYSITCSDHNTEMKIWDCGSWECIQKINLKVEGKMLRLLAELDRTASYLILSSLETRNCYVLQVVNTNNKNLLTAEVDEGDSEGNDKKDSSTRSCAIWSCNGTSVNPPVAYIKSIAEFPLSSGILSFSIVDVSGRRFKCDNDNYLFDEIEEYDEANSVYCVVIRTFIVQSKSMQQCNILYQPIIDSSELHNSKLITKTEKKHSLAATIAATLKTPINDPAILEASATTAKLNSASNEGIFPNPHNLSKEENIDGSHALETLLGIVAGDAQEAQDGSPKTIPFTSNKGAMNLLTPDSFTNIRTDNDSSEKVNSDVLNTILMLASVAGQTPSSSNKEKRNLIDSTVIEEQKHIETHQKQHTQKKYPPVDSMTSGGSSPSREVQEIMSSSDFKSTSFAEHKFSQQQQQKVKPIVDTGEIENPRSSMQHDWVKSPDIQQGKVQNSADLLDAASLISQPVNTSTSSNLNGNLMPIVASHKNNSINANQNVVSNNHIYDKNSEQSEDSKLTQLIELIKQQNIEIKALQNEVTEMKTANSTNSAKAISESIFKLELALTKSIEQHVKRIENDHKKRLGAFLAGREQQQREMREMFVQVSQQYILQQLGEMTSKIISMEFQRHLGPLLISKIDSLQHQIHIEVFQKLSSFDALIKENITQVCKNKNIIDVFGKSVLLGVQGSLQAAFIESMSSTLIPAYEKSSQIMFKQLHDTFLDGIKDFLEQFDIYVKQIKPSTEISDELVTKISGFHKNLDAMVAILTETMLEVRTYIKGLDGVVSRQIPDLIRTEVRKCCENTAQVLRSQANTPAPVFDVKEAIKHFLQQGQINKAFHQALLANDLSLVEFAMKSTDHNLVFTPKCCLEQKVLLSLIQQIGSDMINHNELKQNYLSEAVLAINPADPITREHAPKVLQELHVNCQMFLVNCPKSAQCSSVRMLLKAVEAYKDQFFQ